MSKNKQDHIGDTNKMLGVVDWLKEEFLKLESTVGVQGVFYELLEQAKAMHKEEIVKAVKYGFNKEYFTPNFQDQEELFKQYYNETYGNEQDKSN
jgi:hypothetical protein